VRSIPNKNAIAISNSKRLVSALNCRDTYVIGVINSKRLVSALKCSAFEEALDEELEDQKVMTQEKILDEFRGKKRPRDSW